MTFDTHDSRRDRFWVGFVGIMMMVVVVGFEGDASYPRPNIGAVLRATSYASVVVFAYFRNSVTSQYLTYTRRPAVQYYDTILWYGPAALDTWFVPVAVVKVIIII